MAVQMSRGAPRGPSWISSFGNLPQSKFRQIVDAKCGENLPASFVRRVASDMVWEGERYQNRPELYQYNLSDADVVEIEMAAGTFQGEDLCRHHP